MKFLKTYKNIYNYNFKNGDYVVAEYLDKNLDKKKLFDQISYLDDYIDDYIDDFYYFVEFMKTSVGKIFNNFSAHDNQNPISGNKIYGIIYQDVPDNEYFRRNMLYDENDIDYIKNNLNINDCAIYYLNEYFLRLATSEEIEDYEMKINAKNFNL